jgi:ATP-binding cassette, subfamily B, bacterial MsbA
MNFLECGLLYRYVSPYRKKIFYVIVLAIFCAFFEAINLGALVPLLQLINSPDDPGGAFWSLLKQLLSIAGLELTFQTLLVLMCILFLIGQSLSYVKKNLQAKIKNQFNADLMNTIFGNTLYADMKYHYSQKGGMFIEIINRESDQASTSLFAISEIFSCFLLILVYFAMLLYISPLLTGISVLIAVSSLILLNFLILRSKEFGIFVVDCNSKLNEFVHERINLLKLIKIFSTEKMEQDRFLSLTGPYANYNCAYFMNGVKIEMLFQIIIFLIAISVLYISTAFLNLSLPLLLIFIFILVRLTDPLRSLNSQRHVLAGQLASLEKIDTILHESELAKTIKDGNSTFEGLKTAIRINHLNFCYIPQNPTLTDISIEIKKNEMIAIVGASGSGKSTMVDLIIRLMDADSGEITIDEKNIRDFSIESYHKKIGFVSQESYIFHDSILNNICYGSNHISLVDAVSAAKISNAHDFIISLPENYQMVVGDKGGKLSGGEKQRLALARALYKNPEILILDEATSALDSESERIILDSIEKIKHKYTIISIAHRLSTIINADKIVVIENGKVAESGTYHQLIEKNGVFTKYWQIQSVSCMDGDVKQE